MFWFMYTFSKRVTVFFWKRFSFNEVLTLPFGAGIVLPADSYLSSTYIFLLKSHLVQGSKQY